MIGTEHGQLCFTLVIVPQISAYTVQFLAPDYRYGYYREVFTNIP